LLSLNLYGPTQEVESNPLSRVEVSALDVNGEGAQVAGAKNFAFEQAAFLVVITATFRLSFRSFSFILMTQRSFLDISF